MKLRPKTEREEVSYPVSKAKVFKVMGRRIRRVGVAIAVSAASAFVWAGCDDIGVTLAGDVVDPQYFCSEAAPEPAPDFLYPGTFTRCLRPGQSTWAELTLEAERSLSLELIDNTYDAESNFQAVLVDPEGAVVGVLDTDRSFIELVLAPGVWRVTVTQLSASVEGNFALYVDDASTFSGD